VTLSGFGGLLEKTSNRRKLTLCFLSASSWLTPAVAESNGDQFRPEVDFYIQATEDVRLQFVQGFVADQNTQEWQQNIAFYVESALRPALRRKLREHPDVYRERYLTFRAGYWSQANISNRNSGAERRGIIEVTSRYKLPLEVVISNRVRGEFRFISDQPFSSRFRDKLRVEHDARYRWLKIAPYLYDEVFYDTRYEQWTPNRYGAGVEFLAGPRVVLEPYYFRQNGSHSNPSHLNVFAFTLSLYF
jgi:hypothetical protein